MENTRDSVISFLNKWTIKTHPNDDERSLWLDNFSHDDYIDLCQAYAASVSPEVVVPSDEEIKNAAFNQYIVDAHQEAFDRRPHSFIEGAKWAISRLNTAPTGDKSDEGK